MGAVEVVSGSLVASWVCGVEMRICMQMYRNVPLFQMIPSSGPLSGASRGLMCRKSQEHLSTKGTRSPVWASVFMQGSVLSLLELPHYTGSVLAFAAWF